MIWNFQLVKKKSTKTFSPSKLFNYSVLMQIESVRAGHTTQGSKQMTLFPKLNILMNHLLEPFSNVSICQGTTNSMNLTHNPCPSNTEMVHLAVFQTSNYNLLLCEVNKISANRCTFNIWPSFMSMSISEVTLPNFLSHICLILCTPEYLY